MSIGSAPRTARTGMRPGPDPGVAVAVLTHQGREELLRSVPQDRVTVLALLLDAVRGIRWPVRAYGSCLRTPRVASRHGSRRSSSRRRAAMSADRNGRGVASWTERYPEHAHPRNRGPRQ